MPRSVRTDRVFHRNGEPLTRKLVDGPWRAAVKAAGIEYIRFHDLRHTAASWLVMAGVPLYEVQRVLMHSDPRMTMRYAHLAPDFLRGAMARLDTFVPPSRESEAVNRTVNT